MLTISNLYKVNGWIFRNGEYEIKRAFEFGKQYIFYIEAVNRQTPFRYIISLSREWNNDSEQLYCLSGADGKRQSVGWADIKNKDRFTLYIERMFE